MFIYLYLGFVTALGLALTIFGIHVTAKMYGKHSVEVEAECIGVKVGDETIGISPRYRKHYFDVKKPVYRYWYRGKEYIGSPTLTSNRPGYSPKAGPCKIRINPDRPESIYSSERKFVSAILISIGISFMVLPWLSLLVLPHLI